jgi:putative transport protein
MLETFQQNPLLLLFTVMALGYGLGEVRIFGFKLGVAAVLFVGLAFGAMDPLFSVPQLIIFLGLTIFVYTVGLSSGPAFFTSLRRYGLRDINFALGAIILSAALAYGLHLLFDFDAATTAGLYAGASTNTPALAGLLDAIQKTAAQDDLTEMSQRAVVGYSLSYPMGVLGVMLVIYLMQRAFRINYSAEAKILQLDFPLGEELISRTYKVARETAIAQSVRAFRGAHPYRIVFGRVKRGDTTFLSNWDTIMEEGDQLVIIGNEVAHEAMEGLIGPQSAEQLTYDRSVYDVRRLFISNSDIAGKTIASLNLSERFSLIITRVQRGDMDLLAGADTTLELGDRILLVAKREDVTELSEIFGNSYEGLSRVNLLSFGLGMTLGLLLGMFTISLPGGYSFNLGFAGGPLIVALILGQLRRTGPIVWTLPYGANLTLRQFGLILLLAGIGIRSGQTFFQTVATDLGWKLFLSGTLIAVISTATTLIIGYKLLRIPFSFLGGMVGSQPAVLDFAIEQAGNKYPTIGYTRILPIMLIGKILFVQILYNLLG